VTRPRLRSPAGEHPNGGRGTAANSPPGKGIDNGIARTETAASIDALAPQIVGGRGFQGVAQDTLQTQMWWNLAAAQGSETAGKYRNAAAAKMTPDQLAEAQRLARDWKLTASVTQ